MNNQSLNQKNPTATFAAMISRKGDYPALEIRHFVHPGFANPEPVRHSGILYRVVREIKKRINHLQIIIII